MRRVTGVLVAIGCLLGGARALADVVVLDNGARFEGTVVSDDARGVVLERTSGGSRSTISWPRSRVKAVERSAPAAPSAGTPAAPPTLPGPAVATRDEWWLLESGARVVGGRRLLLVATEDGGRPGWRIEERLWFLARPKVPAVEVQRVEDATADFLPVSVFYRETGDGDAGDATKATAYQTIRSGPIRDGTFELTEVSSRAAPRTTSIPIPPRARSPLAAREALARAVPRRTGLVDVPFVDAARGEVRVVRAGFTSLAAGDAEVREDVLRIEDGDRTLESRWAPGDPPRCVVEDIAPGIVARPATIQQVRAALAPKAEGPKAPTLETSPLEPAGRRDVSLPECGFTYALPGASWVLEPVEPREGDEGVRLVSKASSRIHMADLRVEWDPKGADRTTSPEEPLLARLRRLAPDLAIVEPKAPLSGRPNTFWLGLVGTQRGERLRMLALAADRGAARITMLISCPESAWADAHGAMDAILASFRWL